MRTRALQTALQTEDDFLEYARAFQRTATEEEATTLPSFDGRAIQEETPGGLVSERRIDSSLLSGIIHYVASSQSGMEQLENLVKLMEELSELRDQNCMLKRKVRVLEDLKQGRQQQPPPPPPPRPEAHKDRLRVVPDVKINFPLSENQILGLFPSCRASLPSPR